MSTELMGIIANSGALVKQQTPGFTEKPGVETSDFGTVWLKPDEYAKDQIEC